MTRKQHHDEGDHSRGHEHGHGHSNQQGGQSRRRVIVTGATAVAASVPLVGSTVSADDGSGGEPIDQQGILADGVGDADDIIALFRGYSSRLSSGLTSPAPASTLADRMRNEFNANADHWLGYGNWLLDEQGVSPLGSATVGVDVAITRSRWPLRSSERVRTAIDVEFDADHRAYTGLEWRRFETGEDGDGDSGEDDAPDPEDFDYFVEIRNLAAERGADELQSFRHRFIDENGSDHALPDSTYVSTIAGRHAMDLFFGSESKHVLQLLLGDPDGE